jgi:hypothetical protein
MSTVDLMATHLQFLGYEITREDERIRAAHPAKLGFSIRPFGNGVLLTSIFGCSDGAKSQKLTYFELINSLNENARVARFYADDDLDFFIEAWYPDYYHREQFGFFVELWNDDCDQIFSSEDFSQFLR